MREQEPTTETVLDWAYHWESRSPDRVYLIQPMGGARPVRQLTWKQAIDQARRIAAYLGSLELPAKSHIALLSKNTAYWILADLAIQMAGHVSIALYPTLGSAALRHILSHSESKLIFVGKLDDYEAMAPGIPNEMPRIALPLSPHLESVPRARPRPRCHRRTKKA